MKVIFSTPKSTKCTRSIELDILISGERRLPVGDWIKLLKGGVLPQEDDIFHG
jgi:hypothetical protein